MTMQAFLEVGHSELFQKHFFGPANIGLIPEGKVPETMKIALIGIQVDAHDAASGSVYRGMATVNGEPAYIFDLGDGSDIFECMIFQRNVGAITIKVANSGH